MSKPAVESGIETDDGKPRVVWTSAPQASAEAPDFLIEKNVPLPPARELTAWHPFARMEVGDSVFIPVKPGRNTPQIRACARQFRRKQGWRFVSREQSGGVRVWRTA